MDEQRILGSFLAVSLPLDQNFFCEIKLAGFATNMDFSPSRGKPLARDKMTVQGACSNSSRWRRFSDTTPPSWVVPCSRRRVRRRRYPPEVQEPTRRIRYVPRSDDSGSKVACVRPETALETRLPESADRCPGLPPSTRSGARTRRRAALEEHSLVSARWDEDDAGGNAMVFNGRAKDGFRVF